MPTWMSGLSSGTAIAIGILLMILGVIAVAVGIGGGIAKMIRDFRDTPAASADGDPFEALEKLIKALTAFLEALIKAPVWLSLVVVGFALVTFGAWLTGAA